MESLIDFALKEKFSKVKKLRPRLDEMKKLVDWGKFRKFFPDRESDNGRPNYDKILMTKILFLQGWYGISDEEIEFQINDRISFQHFLDFPKTVPDHSTIWRFREEFTETDTIDKIWEELQRQINEKNIKISKGVIQDATFIVADPGKKRSGMDDRGQAAKTSRNRDGSWTKKGKKSIFGFKAHTKMQRGSKIITKVGVTTARVHDGKIDLTDPGDVVYRDRGYTGIPTRAKGDATMKRGKLSPKQKFRNKRIQRKRAQGEHPYGTIRRSLKGGTTKLTTVHRVFVQTVFVCAAYNLFRLAYLVKDSVGV